MFVIASRILIAFALAALLCNPSAASDNDTPEATFGGVWRVVDAKPAPWAKPRALTPKDAPLIGYQLEFAGGEVKGPPSPIACAHTRYRTVVVPPQGMFQGNLPKGREGKTARAMGFDTPEITTLRVDCNTGTFDYHLTGDGQMYFALDNVLYTMAHPEENDAKPGWNAPSFDCLRAKTGGEKMICRDAGLARSDRDMAAAYARLKNAETDASFATVQAAQRAWLAYVTKLCNANAPLPSDNAGLNRLQECLSDEYSDRAQRLASSAVLKSAALILEPRMRFFTKTKTDTSDSDIYPWMPVGSQAAAFNVFIAATLKLDKRRMDDKDLFPFGNDVGDIKLYARRSYSVTRFDGNIASLQVQTYDYTGGAHEAIGEYSLNWNMAQKREMKLADVFDDPSRAVAFVAKYCVKDLHEQNSDAGEDDFQPAAVTDVVKDIRSWLFGRDKATVHFTVYTVTSFAGGEYDVEIPYAVLKPLLRRGSAILGR